MGARDKFLSRNGVARYKSRTVRTVHSKRGVEDGVCCRVRQGMTA